MVDDNGYNRYTECIQIVILNTRGVRSRAETVQVRTDPFEPVSSDLRRESVTAALFSGPRFNVSLNWDRFLSWRDTKLKRRNFK